MGEHYEKLNQYDSKIGNPGAYYCEQISFHSFYNYDDQDFQKSIDFIADAVGIPLNEIADYVGVSIPSVKRWKEGKNLPNSIMRNATLEQLALLISHNR